MNPKKMELLQSDELMQVRAGLVRELLSTIPGEDITREGLKETPWRIAKMFDELYAGYKENPHQVLMDAMFTQEHAKNLVVVKDIPFSSMCEHHMMPFMGTVSIAYIPQDGKIVGLSKFPRLVRIMSKRLQVQEALGTSILETIKDVMNPFGVAVIIKAQHTCMTSRGIEAIGSSTTTSALDGIFFVDGKARRELFDVLAH